MFRGQTAQTCQTEPQQISTFGIGQRVQLVQHDRLQPGEQARCVARCKQERKLLRGCQQNIRREMALPLTTPRRRIARPCFDSNRQRHLGYRLLEIARHVDGKRLERRDVKCVQYGTATGGPPGQIDETGKETGQCLSAAGGRDEKDGVAGLRLRQKFELVRTGLPATCGEPGVEPGRQGRGGHRQTIGHGTPLSKPSLPDASVGRPCSAMGERTIMFLLVKDVLNAGEVQQVLQLAKTVPFVDGRQSNPHNTAKRNLQVDVNHPDAVRISQIAGAAIARNEEIRNFAFPKRIASPLLSRYEPGMTYGAHADAPFLPLPAGPLRSDVSGTLFLEDPGSYEGGALCIHLGSERVFIKGAPGEMIIYPSTTLHEVTPVVSGRRLAIFTFIESVIPDQVQRDLLFQLYELHALEGFNVTPENRMRMQYISSCLHRMWAR